MAAARRLGVELTVASDHTSVFEAAQPGGLLRLDFAAPESAAAQSARFARQFPVDAVFGVDDDTAVIAAHIARGLGLPHASVAACEAARDKHRQRQLMAAGGVRVPFFRLIAFADDLEARSREVPFPCVLKPTGLSMSRGVIRADEPAEFVAAARRIEKIVECGPGSEAFLCEEFVPGIEVAVEGLLTGGGLEVLAIFDKPDPLDGPYFEETIYVTPSGLPAGVQDAVTGCVAAACRAIGLDRGPVHAEVRWNDRGAWLIELAARPIGGRCSNVLRFGEQTLEEVLLSSALAIRRQPTAISPGAAGVMMIPTPAKGVLKAMEGVAEARNVPRVEGVDITVAPGQQLVPLPEGSRYLGFIFARGDNPDEAVSALRAAHALLKPVIA